MAARWAALAIALVVLLIVGIFLTAVLRPPALVATGTEGGAGVSVAGKKRISSQIGSWTLTAEVALNSTSTVAVAISITDNGGRPATPSAQPTAVLRMVDMAMGVEPVVLVQDGPGIWRGSGRLSMAGRWTLQVDVDGKSIYLPFETTFR